MKTYYVISAIVTRKITNGRTFSRQAPTFLLDADIQGIVDERHALNIAFDVLNPTGDPSVTINADVVRTGSEP